MSRPIAALIFTRLGQTEPTMHNAEGSVARPTARDYFVEQRATAHDNGTLCERTWGLAALLADYRADGKSFAYA